MTRSHRRAHRLLWIVLAISLWLGIAIALVFRAPAHAETQADMGEMAR